MNCALASLSSSQLREAVTIAEELERRRKRRKLSTYFPDAGPLRRELYAKHMEFFRVGTRYRERAIVAGNRVGKTIAGGYEVTVHLTGLYPDWWEGKRFEEPVRVWVAGDTAKTSRDVIQETLLGPYEDIGTGLIPGDCLVGKPLSKAGVPNAIEIVNVKHVSGGNSVLCIKSYDQRRESFQGTAQHVIWLDEEPPADIYGECLVRTMTTKGVIICTFTPLMGITEVVKSFLPGGQIPKGDAHAMR